MQAQLKDGGRGAVRGAKSHRVQRTLVGTQIGFAVMLVIGATLTIRSFANLVRIDPGFDVSGVRREFFPPDFELIQEISVHDWHQASDRGMADMQQ